MKSKAARLEGPSPLDWMETAVWLIRSAPKGALLCYYTGSATCVLGMVYFWADMSQGAFARDHIMEASLGAVVLYVWMKCWQTVFLSKLRAHLLMEREAPWTVGRLANLVAIQAAFQPIGLCLRLIAAQILIPYIWTYSLFMGVAILGDGSTPSLRAVFKGSFQEAALWWRQTHLALLGLLGFAVFIWLNIFVISLGLPFLLRMLLGIESAMTISGWAMINTTFLVATLAVTYLCFDPLRKAVFLVRHFQGASRATGEDLHVELKALRSGARTALAALVLLGMFLDLPLAPGRAAEPATPPPIESSQLDESANRVLEHREYAWRMPRDQTKKVEQKGWLASFLEGVVKTVRKWFKKLGDLFHKFMKWLRGLFDHNEPETAPSSGSLGGGVARSTLIVLAIALVLVLGVLIWRSRKNRRELATLQAAPVVVVPDLNEENVTADQLPEDGWLSMARDLMDRGEMRLALRALYLAGLAHLGQRELIRIARHKSNWDYDRELRRRARGNDDLLTAFDANLTAFEASWYGEHEVTAEGLGGFTQNLERIRAC